MELAHDFDEIIGSLIMKGHGDLDRGGDCARAPPPGVLVAPRPLARHHNRSGAKLTWPYGHGYSDRMKSIAAGKFKDVCLKTLDDVATTKTAVVITKRGRPVAKLVPYVEPARKRSLAGSVVREVGDPFATGERWDADAS